jgi:hypothetical protein
MSLSDLASLGSFVSGVAVTVSLIYLIIQTRQNVRHTRALIQQGASARTIQIALSQTEAGNAAAFLEANGVDATQEAIRRMQFGMMCTTWMAALEDIHGQRTDGLLTDEQFARNCWEHKHLMSQPALRAFWLANRAEIGKVAPKFHAFVDSLITDTVAVVTSPADRMTMDALMGGAATSA